MPTSCRTCASTHHATNECSGSGTGAAAAPGGARFVGDAEVRGIQISRVLNAACYAITGIALFVLSAQTGSHAVWVILFGIACLAYAAKIVLTQSSYWVSTIIYIAPIVAVGAAITAMSR